MIEELANGLERNLLTALVLSGLFALLIVAAVGMIWLKGKRLVRDHRRDVHGLGGTTMFSRRAEPPPPGEAGSGPRPEGAAGEMGSRLVREAAARAAALREAWDRSYREARAPESPSGEDQPSGHDLGALLEELVREQRETNALLRELLGSLRQPRD